MPSANSAPSRDPLLEDDIPPTLVRRTEALLQSSYAGLAAKRNSGLPTVFAPLRDVTITARVLRVLTFTVNSLVCTFVTLLLRT